MQTVVDTAAWLPTRDNAPAWKAVLTADAESADPRRREGRMTHDLQPVDLAMALEFAYRTAVVAGEATLPHFRQVIEIEDKRNFLGYDPVTAADREAESVIRAPSGSPIRPRHPRRGARARVGHVALHVGDRPGRRDAELHPGPVALGRADRAA
jgi:hypothetical protein